MNWGDIVLAVRSLHLEMLERWSLPLKSYLQDVELDTASIPFPKATGDMADWEWNDCPPQVQEALEMHSVERALLEGPLLPIECISFASDAELDALETSILNLEKQWLEKTRLFTEERFARTTEAFKQKWLRVRARSGLKRLKAIG